RAKRQAMVGKPAQPVISAPPKGGPAGAGAGAGKKDGGTKQMQVPPPTDVAPPPEKSAEPDTLDPATSPQSAVLGQGFLGVGVGPAHRDGDSKRVIRTSYLLPFELVSIHLLVVLIGAAYLARAKRRRPGELGGTP